MFTAKSAGTPANVLQLMIAAALLLPLLVIGLSSARADHWAFCKVCHRTFLMPGGGGGAGVARITCDTCRCRTKDGAFDECCNAQQLANQIIQLFKMRCDSLNAVTKELEDIKKTLANPNLSEGEKQYWQRIYNEDAGKQNALVFDMNLLAEEWKELQHCNVKGQLPNCPLYDSLPKDAKKDAGNQGAGPQRQQHADQQRGQGYDRAADAAEHTGAILDYLNSGAGAIPTEPTGSNVPRYRLTKSYRLLGVQYRIQAGWVGTGKAPALTAKEYGVLFKPTVLADPAGDKPPTDLAGRARVALEQRLQANRYLSAAHDSFGRYLAAKDAKDTKAMQLQLQALVDYSSVALETARTAAVRRFEYEQKLLTVLEASLGAKGFDLEQSVKKFQDKLKADGLPETVRAAAKEAELTKEETTAYQERLAKLTAADMRASVHLLKTRVAADEAVRKANAKDKTLTLPQPPDAVALLAQGHHVRHLFAPLAPPLPKKDATPEQ